MNQGGHVSLLPELASFIECHNLYEANADGYDHGTVDKGGSPSLKGGELSRLPGSSQKTRA